MTFSFSSVTTLFINTSPLSPLFSLPFLACLHVCSSPRSPMCALWSSFSASFLPLNRRTWPWPIGEISTENSCRNGIPRAPHCLQRQYRARIERGCTHQMRSLMASHLRCHHAATTSTKNVVQYTTGQRPCYQPSYMVDGRSWAWTTKGFCITS